MGTYCILVLLILTCTLYRIVHPSPLSPPPSPPLSPPPSPFLLSRSTALQDMGRIHQPGQLCPVREGQNCMGLMVKCCESYVEVCQGDIERVTKVRSSACDVCGETVPLVYACCVGVREYIVVRRQNQYSWFPQDICLLLYMM